MANNIGSAIKSNISDNSVGLNLRDLRSALSLIRLISLIRLSDLYAQPSLISLIIGPELSAILQIATFK